MEKTEKKSLKKGDLLQLKIANLDTKGRAYGFFDENKIYVNINAAENQVVEGIFVKRRRKYELIHCKIIDFAGRQNVIYDDIERQNGGCNYQYYTYDEQLEIKAGHIKKELDKIIKYDYIFEEPVRSVKPDKYRNKMEFSFGNAVKGGPIILGLHKQNSFHDIVEVDGLKLMDDNFKEKAEFHIILNADIIFEENTIEKMIDYMRKNPEIGQIGPKIYESSGEVNKSCRLLPTPLNLIFRRFFPIKSIVDKMDYNYEMRWCDYNSIMEVPILSGCLMFIRTDILKNVGMFDTRYFMYMEDYDLCRRIGQKYKVIFYPEVKIIHKHGKASYKTRKMMIAHINSAIKYFNKWGWFFDKERKTRNKECIKRYKK